jgi:hypothetical protein
MMDAATADAFGKTIPHKTGFVTAISDATDMRAMWRALWSEPLGRVGLLWKRLPDDLSSKVTHGASTAPKF